MRVKVCVLTEKNRKLNAEMELLKSDVRNVSHAVEIQPNCGDEFKVTLSNEDSQKKGTCSTTDKSHQDSSNRPIILHDDKKLDTTKTPHTESRNISDTAGNEDYLSTEEYAVRLKVVERERDVLLEFIKVSYSLNLGEIWVNDIVFLPIVC